MSASFSAEEVEDLLAEQRALIVDAIALRANGTPRRVARAYLVASEIAATISKKSPAKEGDVLEYDGLDELPYGSVVFVISRGEAARKVGHQQFEITGLSGTHRNSMVLPCRVLHRADGDSMGWRHE